MTKLINGKEIAQNLRNELKNEINNLRSKTGKVPGLAVVQVGNVAASSVYVKAKTKSAKEVGIEVIDHHLKEETSDGIVNEMPGVVRTSDVAVPGSVPQNWNPFAPGVNTADEFVLSDTSTVQDMLELQGNMYIYTNILVRARLFRKNLLNLCGLRDFRATSGRAGS